MAKDSGRHDSQNKNHKNGRDKPGRRPGEGIRATILHPCAGPEVLELRTTLPMLSDGAPGNPGRVACRAKANFLACGLKPEIGFPPGLPAIWAERGPAVQRRTSMYPRLIRAGPAHRSKDRRDHSRPARPISFVAARKFLINHSA